MNLFRYHIIVKQQLLRGIKMPTAGLLFLFLLLVQPASGSYGYLKTEEEEVFQLVVAGRDRTFSIPYHGLTVGDCYRLMSRNGGSWLWDGSTLFMGQIVPTNLPNGQLENIPIPENIPVGDYEFDVQVGVAAGLIVCYSDAVTLRLRIVGSSDGATDTICSGQELAYTPECIVSGIARAEDFRWSRAAVAGIREAAMTGEGAIREVLTNETTEPVAVRYVYVVAANACCDEMSYEVVVTVMPAIRFEIANATPELCSGERTNISLLPSNLNYLWTMDEDAGVSGEGNVIADVLHCETLPLTFTYRVIPEHGICSEQQTTQVKVNPLPEVYLRSNLSSQGSGFTRKLEFLVDPEFYKEYRFDYNGELKVQNESVFVCYDWSENKENTLKVTVVSPEGCENADSIVFIGPDMKLPNSITPNGDGINDRLLEGYDLEVFNRNGSQLYRGKNGWDGKYRGKRVESGTYLYVVRILQEDGTVVMKRYYVYVSG